MIVFWQSCLVTSTLQPKIIKLAQAADPKGARTMGVLTKPDLATETVTRDAVMDLVLGRRSNLKLGYFVVKNRSADDYKSILAERADSEKAFFIEPPWISSKVRCGVPALKVHLRCLLTKISKREFPHVKAEVEQRLRVCKTEIEAVGPARSDQGAQRVYLGRLATRFQSVTQAALNGFYAADPIFTTEPDLKLITRVIKMNEVFSNVFWRRGHRQDVNSVWDDDGELCFGDKATTTPFEVPLMKYYELRDIIQTENYKCPDPSPTPLMDRIKEVYESNRGPELGTVIRMQPINVDSTNFVYAVRWHHP